MTSDEKDRKMLPGKDGAQFPKDAQYDPTKQQHTQLAGAKLFRTAEAIRQGIARVDPEILGGEPVFAGTRVPVQNFVDYEWHGKSIDDFLDDFPSVTRDQAERWAKLGEP